MYAFRGILGVVLFSGLTVAAMMGVEFPHDPDCVGRCSMEMFADLQDRVGGGGLAVLFALSALYSAWYATRGR